MYCRTHSKSDPTTDSGRFGDEVEVRHTVRSLIHHSYRQRTYGPFKGTRRNACGINKALANNLFLGIGEILCLSGGAKKWKVPHGILDLPLVMTFASS